MIHPASTQRTLFVVPNACFCTPTIHLKTLKSGQPLLKAPNAPVPMRPLFGGSTTILSVLLSFLHSIANDSKQV